MDKKRKREEIVEPNKKPKFDICVICLELMEKNTTCLPCGHSYHTKCIDTWVCKNNSCPCCRKKVYDVITADEYIMNLDDFNDLLFPLVIEV